MEKPKKKSKALPAVILLKDLAPRKDVKGGSGKLLFGQSVGASQAADEILAGKPASGASKARTGKSGSTADRKGRSA